MTETMKDSGQEWIGAIPESWDTNRICYCLNEINVKNSPVKTEQILSLVKDKGVMLYEEKGDVGNKAKEDITGYKVAFPNTLIVNSMNILIGSVGISKYKGCVSPVYYVFREKDNSDLRFVNYIFNTREFQKELRKYANGILEIRLRVSATDIFNRKIPLPPKEEQIKIADFLDEKCAEIDELSEDIQKQIDILNDYKKSVITRAVTKGLDPNAEMKDSGIEWIGTIPKSWSLIRLKNAAWLKGRIGWQGLRADEFKDDESLPYLITGTDFYNGIVNWDTCVHITEERFNQDRNIQIKEDDLLITKDGTIGKVAIAKKCPQRVSLNSGIFIIRNIGKYKYYSRFMYYVLQSDEFIEWYSVANAGNSTILHLNQEKFYNFVFALPDIESQKYIAERLDVKCAHIDYSISEKYDQLSKLDSYKKSIIYEYVTGKKRVKGVL